MNTNKTGGPAFPVEVTSDNGELMGVQTGNRQGWHTGMTLRDYFAATSPISVTDAVLAADVEPNAPDVETAVARAMRNEFHRPKVLRVLAELRGEYADAMLAEREKNHE